MGEYAGGNSGPINSGNDHDPRDPAFSIESRLDYWAGRLDLTLDKATEHRPAADLLYETVLIVSSEDGDKLDDQTSEDLNTLKWSVATHAFDKFSYQQQLSIIAAYIHERESGALAAEPLELTHAQQVLVTRVAARIGVAIRPEQTALSFEPIVRKIPRRVIDIPAPELVALLEQAQDGDKIGYILENIGDLTMKQQIQLLFMLSDDEYIEFKRRQKEGAASALADLDANPSLIPDPEDRFRARSDLAHGIPAYIVEVDIRKRFLEFVSNYPVMLDFGLQEDPRFKRGDGLQRLRLGRPLTYEEAIEATKFEYARNFYRNHLFPIITRFREPLPINLRTITEALAAYKKTLSTDMPATDITIEDVQRAVLYYLDYETDNDENCGTHNEVLRTIRILFEIEEALSGNDPDQGVDV